MREGVDLTAEDLALAEEGVALGRELMRRQELGLIPANPPGTLLQRMLEDGLGGVILGEETVGADEDDLTAGKHSPEKGP